MTFEMRASAFRLAPCTPGTEDDLHHALLVDVTAIADASSNGRAQSLVPALIEHEVCMG
jgi:hypothetical protein